MRALTRAAVIAVALCLATAPLAGCGRGGARPGTRVPMGSWPQWQDLSPLVDSARHHANATTVDVLIEARDLLRKGKALSADRALAKHADGSGRHWIAVARADVAALHFTVCVRGVAWRLEDRAPDGPPISRSVDRNPTAPILGSDVSVEALLTNVDAAVETGDATLATQARIARARTATFVTGCPPTPQALERASSVLRADLALLAAEGKLTPDLAYVWASIQLEEFSAAAARPLLLQAREGGFDDPGVEYLLAIIALDLREWDNARKYATSAAARFSELGDDMQAAQCWFVLGEAARQAGDVKTARDDYEKAIGLVPAHVAAILGRARLVIASKGEPAAVDYLHKRLPKLEPRDSASNPYNRLVGYCSNLEAVAIMTDGDLQLSDLARRAMLQSIDDDEDAGRRGCRYYFAAILDARLGDFAAARGHGATAAVEFDEFDPPPVDVRAFLDRLAEATR